MKSFDSYIPRQKQEVFIYAKFISHPQEFPFSQSLHLKSSFYTGNHEEQENGHILENRPKSVKIRALHFLQLLKFEKIMCLYFFIFWPIFRDMAIFWIFRFSEKNISFVKKIKTHPFQGTFPNAYFSVITRTFPHMGKIVKLILN